MDDREKTLDFIATQRIMVVSVVDEGGPWSVPITILHRDGNVFEWDSRVDTRHSLAIEKNPNVSLLMFRPRGENEGKFGFYASATAEVVSTRDEGYARYRVTVTRAWINDESLLKREVDIGGSKNQGEL